MYYTAVLRAVLQRVDVDDFFAANRSDVHWTSMRCLDVVAALVGVPLDGKKSVDDAISMVLLGGRLVVLPQEKLAVIDPPPAEPSVEAPPPRKRPTRAL